MQDIIPYTDLRSKEIIAYKAISGPTAPSLIDTHPVEQGDIVPLPAEEFTLAQVKQLLGLTTNPDFRLTEDELEWNSIFATARTLLSQGTMYSVKEGAVGARSVDLVNGDNTGVLTLREYYTNGNPRGAISVFGKYVVGDLEIKVGPIYLNGNPADNRCHIKVNGSIVGYAGEGMAFQELVYMHISGLITSDEFNEALRRDTQDIPFIAKLLQDMQTFTVNQNVIEV